MSTASPWLILVELPYSMSSERVEESPNKLHPGIPPAPRQSPSALKGSGEGQGVTDVGILQLVHAIFSLYILHFTFYTLLGTPRSLHPSALKWAGEGRGKRRGTEGKAWTDRLGAHHRKVGFRLIGSVA